MASRLTRSPPADRTVTVLNWFVELEAGCPRFTFPVRTSSGLASRGLVDQFCPFFAYERQCRPRCGFSTAIVSMFAWLGDGIRGLPSAAICFDTSPAATLCLSAEPLALASLAFCSSARPRSSLGRGAGHKIAGGRASLRRQL